MSGSVALFVRGLLALLLVGSLSASSQAVTLTESQSIGASDASAFAEFGAPLAVDGMTAVVGAPGHDANGADAGAIYVFVASGGVWAEQAVLTPADGAAGDAFGCSVSVDGDIALIGACGDDDLGLDAGSAYLFTRSGQIWSESQKLVASDGLAGDGFGHAVGLMSGVAAVGAVAGDGASSDSGAVYMFQDTGPTWLELIKLSHATGLLGDGFGAALALDNTAGPVLVVGSPNDDTADLDAGAAHVYTESSPGTWTLFETLPAPLGTPLALFGSAVSTSGGTVVVGAPGEEHLGVFGGKAYVFELGVGPFPIGELGPQTPVEGARFGESVSADADTTVVGEPGAGGGDGAAHVFAQTVGGWVSRQTLITTTPDSTDAFASAVGVTGDSILVGAPGTVASGASEHVHAYALDHDNDGYGDSVDADDDADGIPDAFEDAEGLDVLDGADASLDSDLDGWSALEEFRHGTDPGNMSDSPAAIVDRHQLVFGHAQRAYHEWAVVTLAGGDVFVHGPGERGSDTLGPGEVTVFESIGGTWVESDHLVASDAATNDQFGYAVARVGDSLLLGAPQDDSPLRNAGSVYVFQQVAGTWVEQMKLLASDATVDDYFGRSVAVSGDVALVGAPGDDDSGVSSGSVYVFRRIAGVWTEVSKMSASDAASGASFGLTLELQGPTAVVGALRATGAAANTGAAYVFEDVLGTFTEQAKLISNDGSAYDNFAGLGSLALDGESLIVGAAAHDVPDDRAGAAYPFERDAGVWVPGPKLSPPGLSEDDEFGRVALSGDLLAVGAPAFTNFVAGRVHIYRREAGTWVELVSVVAADGDSNDRFGDRVSLEGDILAVTAKNHDHLGSRSGALYLFDLDRDDDGLLNFEDPEPDSAAPTAVPGLSSGPVLLQLLAFVVLAIGRLRACSARA